MGLDGHALKRYQFCSVIQKLKISIDFHAETVIDQTKQICAMTNSPIDADGTKIEDAGCTHHHIKSDKDVTVDLAKAPLSHNLKEKKH